MRILSGCIVGGFWKFLIGPGGVRTQALVAVLVPVLIPLSYVLVLLGCGKHKDVLHHGDRHLAEWRALFPDRHPYLQPAIAGRGIELLVITLEVGRVGGFHA